VAPGTYLRRIDPFPVVRADGDRIEQPFVGGFNIPRPQLVDIDATTHEVTAVIEVGRYAAGMAAPAIRPGAH
jgi:hypothetical protein